MSPNSANKLRLFYSYAREDEELRNRLDKHLTVLKDAGLIESWHDRDITAGDPWETTINEQLQSADIILLLISVDFMASKYIRNVELKQAIERHNKGEACVIPVILRSVEWTETVFGKLQALPKDGAPVVSWSDHDDGFVDVIRGIKAAAHKMLSKRGQSLVTAKPAVYLAETDSSKQSEFYRNGIAAELTANGYPILPDEDLPDESPGYENAVINCLKKVKLSVHVMGSKYGRTVTGASESIPALQLRLAEKRRSESDLQSLIWVQPEVIPETERQAKLLKYLDQPEAQKNAELSRRPFEIFKDRVIEKLEGIERLEKKRNARPDSTTQTIYLMCEQRDYEFIESVHKVLDNNGFEVFLSDNISGQGPGTQSHQNYLRECDATLIFYGQTDRIWVSKMIFDLYNFERLRKSRPIVCKAIYIAKPENDYLTRIEKLRFTDSVETALQPFVKCLQRGG